MKQEQTGFTLLELLVAVAVVAILAAIAVPAYNNYVTRSKLSHAQSTLSDLRVKLEQYYQDNRNYGSTATTCGMAMPAADYFNYTCIWGATSNNQSFIATATGITAQGTGNFTYTINESGIKTTTSSPWGTSTNCWVSKQGGGC